MNNQVSGGTMETEVCAQDPDQYQLWNKSTASVMRANGVNRSDTGSNRQKEVKKKKRGKKAWQLLGEAVIDGNASGSVSVWTWLSHRYTNHSSHAATQDWDAQLQARQHFYIERHLGNIFKSKTTSWLQLFLRCNSTDLTHCLKPKPLRPDCNFHSTNFHSSNAVTSH